MKKLMQFLMLPFVMLIVACGGGGGSAGTSSGGVTSSTFDTVLSVVLKHADINNRSAESVSAKGESFLESTLTTKDGKPVVGQVVQIQTSSLSDLVVFPSGVMATTDKDGKARIKISRASLDRYGSASVSVSFAGTVCDPSCSANVVQYGSSLQSLAARVDPPALRMELRDASNQFTTSIGASGFTSIRASLLFADGTPVANKRVDITGDPARVIFPEGGSQLTDTQGVASVKVVRAALDVVGAGTLNGTSALGGTTASGSIEETVVSAVLDYQVGNANVTLTDLSLGAGSLAAFGNRPISVKARLNGALSTNVPLQVTFNASCGVVSPAVVNSDGTGTANTTYTANSANCAGTNVTVSATAVGAPSVSGVLAVAPSVATNVQFVSASPQLIYLRESVGTTQAQVIFKVVDSSGNPLQNKKLRFSLSNSSTGVSLDKVDNINSVDLTSDSQGLVSAAVYSGTVPTSLNVRATLLDANDAPTNVFSNSNLLTVASGQPVQRSLSIAFDKLSIEGFNVDGTEAVTTLSMADRQGNPVPPGTQVNFVSESGVFLPAVCFVPPPTPATSSSPAIPVSACTVKLRSQGTRPVNGRVSVLAYLVGEEDFVDANGNNVYDSGETFTDLGRAFRDDSRNARPGANGVYDTGEFQVPRAGVPACTASAGCVGDRVWGSADVRTQGTIVFATSGAAISGDATVNRLVISIADGNGNSMPTGSDVRVNTATFGGCGPLGGDFNVKIANTLLPSTFSVPLSGCAPGDVVQVEVTSPLNLNTKRAFTVQ